MLIGRRIWFQCVNGRRSVKGCNQLTKMTLHHTYDKPRNLTLCNRTL